ncbi:MAG: hypothetical protein WBW53_01200 [Terriglobales bacterium]
MTFTGNLIEGLMATVERAEMRAITDDGFRMEALRIEALAVEGPLVEPGASESLFAENGLAETWFASARETADYDSKFMGVA